jgi:hypothetical protein
LVEIQHGAILRNLCDRLMTGNEIAVVLLHKNNKLEELPEIKNPPGRIFY